MAEVAIFFDGLCEPNPGGIACYGFTIHGLTVPGRPIAGAGVIGAGERMTNNVAEWTALGKALAYLVATGAAVDRLDIFGDSKLVIDQITGKAACSAEKLVSLKERCVELLKAIGKPTRAHWLPREQNLETDYLSRAAYVGRVGKPVPERQKEGR